MQRKLKTVFRRSHGESSPTSQSPRASYESSEPASPRADQYYTSSNQRTRAVSDASKGSPQQRRRSRDINSVYDDQRTHNASAPYTVATSSSLGNHPDIDGSIANDYKSYLPVLSSVDDESRNQYSANGRHEGHVADRNIDRNSTSFDADRNKPLPAPPGSADVRIPERRSSKKATHPAHYTHDGIRVDGKNAKLQGSGVDRTQQPISPRNTTSPRALQDGHLDSVGAQTTTANGHRGAEAREDWKVQQQSQLAGVVDLRNTVDTETTTQLAKPVIHEVVKPHEHEVIQHKIYREIHKYSYYNRLQPVMHTEVLPPRHFIPNPDGEGLLEISADELPARTGENRWWSIVQKEVPQTFEIQSRWRSEPEVIEGEPYTTDEGFERKETTIIYPPTLRDMSHYHGPIQPVHFDHKTGKRWLGEVTTMDELREQYDQDSFKMRELRQSLPEVPESPTIKRRPVGA